MRRSGRRPASPAPRPDRPRRRTPLTLRAAGSALNGRADATNERRPSRAARRRGGQSARRWRGRGGHSGGLALGRASAALAPHRPGAAGLGLDLRRREVRRKPSAKPSPCPGAPPEAWAHVPLPPRGALLTLLASQRSEAPGAPHPSPSWTPRGHRGRACTPRALPRGDTGTEKGIAATDCSRHYPLPPPLRLTFKPRQNGAAARLRPGACVSGAEAGGGAGSARAPPSSNDQSRPRSVFALTSQATMPFGSDRSNGHHNSHFPETAAIQRVAAGLPPTLVPGLNVRHVVGLRDCRTSCPKSCP